MRSLSSAVLGSAAPRLISALALITVRPLDYRADNELHWRLLSPTVLTAVAVTLRIAWGDQNGNAKRYDRGRTYSFRCSVIVFPIEYHLTCRTSIFSLWN
jgi:hypothetical protein